VFVGGVSEQGERNTTMTEGQPLSGFPFDPDWVVPTSEVLREWLSDRNLSPRVAVAAAVPRKEREGAARALERVLDDGLLTYEVALVLDRITAIPTRFWLAFEHNYREGLAEGKSVIR
jgi:hypothetical protein